MSGRLQLQLAVEPGPRSNFHLLRFRPHPRELEFSMAYQPHPNFDVHCETKIFALTPKFQKICTDAYKGRCYEKGKNILTNHGARGEAHIFGAYFRKHHLPCVFGWSQIFSIANPECDPAFDPLVWLSPSPGSPSVSVKPAPIPLLKIFSPTPSAYPRASSASTRDSTDHSPLVDYHDQRCRGELQAR